MGEANWTTEQKTALAFAHYLIFLVSESQLEEAYDRAVDFADTVGSNNLTVAVAWAAAEMVEKTPKQLLHIADELRRDVEVELLTRKYNR